jgi:hypothetical protein
MVIDKQPIFLKRVRQIPKQFSWIDHRLVSDRHIRQCSHPAAALYLFLVTVGDEKGLSYYADASIMKLLSMDSAILNHARQNLIRIDLIAWQKPLYQVLSLQSSEKQTTSRLGMDKPLALGDILRQALGGLHD